MGRFWARGRFRRGRGGSNPPWAGKKTDLGALSKKKTQLGRPLFLIRGVDKRCGQEVVPDGSIQKVGAGEQGRGKYTPTLTLIKTGY